ncbi:MAG TPA: hypothetical protein PL193_04625 [Xanthobacteraceae bacterium]|nr:hypothetical protein [Xanthobacteraceae bacterium]
MSRIEKPSFEFFGRYWDHSVSPDGFASSLQKIEVSFLLIALRRFPSALSEVVAAIESLLHSSEDERLASRVGLSSKLRECRNIYPNLQKFPENDLRELREKRNAFEHK